MKSSFYRFFLVSSLVMLGWNLSLALALIVIIFLAIILQSFGINVGYTSPAFIVSTVIGGVLGLGIGIQMGKNATLWFTQRNRMVLVLLWGILILVSVVMFPGPHHKVIFSFIS